MVLISPILVNIINLWFFALFHFFAFFKKIAIILMGIRWYLIVVFIFLRISDLNIFYLLLASLVAQRVKSLPARQETLVQSLGWEDPLEKEMATHSNSFAWRIPQTEESDGLQPTGSQRVEHNSDFTFFTFLSAICISSLDKCLSKSFAHFLIQFFFVFVAL